MNRVVYFIFSFILLVGIISCSQNHKEAAVADYTVSEVSAEAPTADMSMKDMEAQSSLKMQRSLDQTEIAMQDEEMVTQQKDAKVSASPHQSLSSAAAVESGDSKRKFIRTADMRFKTPDVIRSTYSIEDIAVRHGGFVTNSQLISTVNRVNQVDISKDSTLVITYYTVNTDLTLRVPNVFLDTTLKDIAYFVDFLDYRTIKANDVALNMIANDLTQQRLAKNEKRLQNAIDNRGRKLGETMSAEELLLNAQERADYAKLSNLSLTDQIEFSTITIHLYESQRIKKEMTVKAIDHKSLEYKTSLGQKLLNGLNGGWDMLCSILIFCSYIWWLFILAILGIVGIRIYKKHRKSEQ